MRTMVWVCLNRKKRPAKCNLGHFGFLGWGASGCSFFLAHFMVGCQHSVCLRTQDDVKVCGVAFMVILDKILQYITVPRRSSSSSSSILVYYYTTTTTTTTTTILLLLLLLLLTEEGEDVYRRSSRSTRRRKRRSSNTNRSFDDSMLFLSLRSIARTRTMHRTKSRGRCP